MGKVFAVLGAIVLLVVIVCASSYISANNTANSLEVTLKASKENNENVLAQYGQKIQEAAQVPGMQTEDLAKVFTDSLDARYGKDGSQAAMQWIQEQNPNLNQETYTKLQRMIESGRNDFQAAQTKMVDTKRTYETKLGNFWSGMWMKVAGYPRIDLDDYKIVSTTRAKDAFEKGVEDSPLKLR